MKNLTRECEIEGHEGNQPSRICIFKDCNKYPRWCCAECKIDNLHLHGQLNENHIKKQEEFIAFLKDQQNSQSKKIIHACLDSIIQQVKKLISILSNLLQYQESKYSSLITQATNEFLSIDKAQINEILHSNNEQLNLSESSVILQGILKKIQELQYLYTNCSNYQLQFTEINQLQQRQSSKIEQIQTNDIIQQQNLKYDYQDYFEQSERNFLFALQISPNEELIAYGGYNQILTIINLQTKQKLKEIKLDEELCTCSFTNDSKLIYCGDAKGYIYVYNINQNFKKIFKSQVHRRGVTSIYLIDKYQVASCCNYYIIITDIIKNIKIITIPHVHRDKINQIEYDSVNQNIISCSQDSSIKFFSSKNGDVLINQQDAHECRVFQIQLTNNNNNLFSSSFREIILWQIEYKQKQLIQIRKFTEREDLFSFTTLFNPSRILRIYSNYLLISDDNFNEIYQYSHNISEIDFVSAPKQSNSLNYILILGLCYQKSKSIKMNYNIQEQILLLTCLYNYKFRFRIKIKSNSYLPPFYFINTLMYHEFQNFPEQIFLYLKVANAKIRTIMTQILMKTLPTQQPTPQSSVYNMILVKFTDHLRNQIFKEKNMLIINS